MKGYIDLYLLPLPKKNLKKYKDLASRFGKMAREFGALDYREFVANDLPQKGVVSFTHAVKPKRTEVIISSVVSFKSKAQRDQVMKKMFADPRMTEMMKEKPLSDMNKMIYGGFETIVDV